MKPLYALSAALALAAGGFFAVNDFAGDRWTALGVALIWAAGIALGLAVGRIKK